MAVSDHAAHLLACVDGEPRGRAELLSRSRIPAWCWNGAIRELLASGLVVKHGDKRGARYTRRGAPEVPASSRAGSARGVKALPVPRSHAATDYHDVVREVLQEIGIAGPAEEDLRAESRPLSAAGSVGPARGDASSSGPGAHAAHCPLLRAVVSLDGSIPFKTCRKCGGRTQLWLGRSGPCIQCRDPDCSSKELVATSVVDAALRRLQATCLRCERPLRHLKSGWRSGVQCPKGHIELWGSFKGRIRER